MRLQDCQRVYFACTGNTCRSPLAERILKEYLKGTHSTTIESRRASIDSPGLVAPSQGMSKGTEAVIRSVYSDAAFVRKHLSRSFKPRELEEADLVITMEPWHKRQLLQYPQAYRQDKRAKVYTLGELVGKPQLVVEDPLAKEMFLKTACASFSEDYLQGDNVKSYQDLVREQQLMAEAYMPTFRQLDELIAQIVQLQDIPQPLTLDEAFRQDLQSRYATWNRERKQEQRILHRIGKALRTLVPDKKQTPFSLYVQGLYRESAQIMNAEEEEVIGRLEAVQRSFSKVGPLVQNTSIEHAVEIYRTLLHEKIFPALCMSGGYRTPQWTLDTATLGKELETVFVNVSRNIPETMKHTTERDHAWTVKKLGDAILSCAHALCSEEIIEKIYSGLLGKTDLLRDQNDINKKYHGLSETSVTWFGRKTPAYRFTNEPLEDLLPVSLNLDGPVLCVTASGDALCLLAGKGAKEIAAVDVSSIANAWTEYKFQAFLSLSYEEFQQKFAKRDATWKTFPFDRAVSEDAQKIFDAYKKSTKSIICTTDLFMPQGYAASDPSLVGYLESKERYEAMQKAAQNTKVRFFPTDITTFFEQEYVPESSFTTIYLSNILDHTTKEGTKIGKREFDFSKERIHTVLQPVLRYLAHDGTIILNLQWDNRAYSSINDALADSHSIERIAHGTHGGCGSMYVIKRKV